MLLPEEDLNNDKLWALGQQHHLFPRRPIASLEGLEPSTLLGVSWAFVQEYDRVDLSKQDCKNMGNEGGCDRAQGRQLLALA